MIVAMKELLDVPSGTGGQDSPIASNMSWVSIRLRSVFKIPDERRISRRWSHQKPGLPAVEAGEHPPVPTPAGSGAAAAGDRGAGAGVEEVEVEVSGVATSSSSAAARARSVEGSEEGQEPVAGPSAKRQRRDSGYGAASSSSPKGESSLLRLIWLAFIC